MVFYHSPPRIPSLGGMVSYLRSKKIQIPKWEREGQGSTIYLKKLSKANKFIESLIDNKMLTFVDLCDFWDFLVIFWTYRGNIRDFGTYQYRYRYQKYAIWTKYMTIWKNTFCLCRSCKAIQLKKEPLRGPLEPSYDLYKYNMQFGQICTCENVDKIILFLSI